MADIFDVLADGTRRDILRRLLDGEAAVSDLVETLGSTQPTISKHLARLLDAGLVTVREDGRNRIYALRVAPLSSVDAWLSPFLGGAPSSLTGGDAEDAGPTIFAAWAGAEAGDRVGRGRRGRRAQRPRRPRGRAGEAAGRPEARHREASAPPGRRIV